jgi:uncharacterized membrane-anchored protein YitT (DUF2179 family)
MQNYVFGINFIIINYVLLILKLRKIGDSSREL